jgi:hypothetical protein
LRNVPRRDRSTIPVLASAAFSAHLVSRDLIAVDADRRQLALRSPGAAAGA